MGFLEFCNKHANKAWLLVGGLFVFTLGNASASVMDINKDTTAKNIKHENTSYQCQFVDVQDYGNYSVVYNKANRVMYIISDDGNATVMVDESNNPVTWRG